MGFKIDLFWDGLWKALRKGLERVLGSLGDLLGGSMFQIHRKNLPKCMFRTHSSFELFLEPILARFGSQLD